MPVVDIKVIEGVFPDEEKREMVERVTEAPLDRGRAPALGYAYARHRDPESRMGDRLTGADRRGCEGRAIHQATA